MKIKVRITMKIKVKRMRIRIRIKMGIKAKAMRQSKYVGGKRGWVQSLDPECAEYEKCHGRDKISP